MAHSALRDAQRMASRYAEDLANNMESWKRDYLSAMGCRDLEESLIVFNGLMRLFFELKSRFDRCDFSGQLIYDPIPERHLEEAYDELSNACKRVEDLIKEFEGQDYEVTGAEEFRSHLHKIEEFRIEAQRVAKIEGRMGFRGVTMDPEDAAAFRSLAEAVLGRLLSSEEHALISGCDFRDQVLRDRAELAEYRKRFGPL